MLIEFILLTRIKERAYALKEAREEARQKFVDAAYKNQWRDACDDARTLDSKAVTRFMQQVCIVSDNNIQQHLLLQQRTTTPTTTTTNNNNINNNNKQQQQQ